MTKVIFSQPGGEISEVEAEEGSSAMRTALMNGVQGILAECGGEAACATCHVYVAEEWFERTGGPGLDEEDMLEFTESERRPNSRLSCQINITSELAGLQLTIPEEQ